MHIYGMLQLGSVAIESKGVDIALAMCTFSIFLFLEAKARGSVILGIKHFNALRLLRS